MDLSPVAMSSVSQHRLKVPTDPGAPDVAEDHDATALSVEVLEDLVRSNDIDIVGLTGHIKDRKSTRLNSSHVSISYAVFCLKKKKGTTLGGERLAPAQRSDYHEHVT